MQRRHLRKAVEKIAFIGPIVDMGHLGIPSFVGYGMGRSQGKADRAVSDKKPDRNALASMLKWMLIPGYTGYRMGQRSGWNGADAQLRKKKTAEFATGGKE